MKPCKNIKYHTLFFEKKNVNKSSINSIVSSLLAILSTILRVPFKIVKTDATAAHSYHPYHSESYW